MPRDLFAADPPQAAPAGPRDLFATPAPQPAPDTSGVIPQGLSGVNEGMANFLSLPNTLEMGLRSIGPAVGNAMGGHFAMPTESWLPDAGASFRNLGTDTGAIKPVTDDGAGQFARRVGQEVGASLVPALGSEATIASLLAAAGSGAGAAIAQRYAPGNQYAEFAGQLIGGGIPVSIGNQAERMGMKTAAPTLDDLRANKSAAYKAVDDLGVQYTPQAMDDLVTQMQAAGAKINPLRHPKSASMLDDIVAMKGTSPTITQLDELRQTIYRDLIKSSDGGERYFGHQLNNTLDDFISKAGGSQAISGDPVAAASAINTARDLNSRYKKVEDFDRQMEKARNGAGATGSGGNINNQMRGKARQILDNPARTRGYSPEELSALQSVVRPGAGEDLLRNVGKLAPGGNGLMTALNTGAIIHNPTMAVIPAVAQIAKSVADKGTANRAAVLRALLASGEQTPVPLIAPRSQTVLEALMAGQAANQNNPSDQIARLLAAQGGP